MWPNDRTHWFAYKNAIPGQTSQSQILRWAKTSGVFVPVEQFHFASLSHRRALQMPLASRTVFQMDQATLTDKIFLWHQSKRGQNSNMDRSICIRTGRYHKKATQAGWLKPLHNSTDFEWHPFWKNTVISSSYCSRIHENGCTCTQATEFIRLLIGQQC